MEQVSHHPPVTAFHSQGDGWSIYGHFEPRPKLVGMHVEVDIKGKRFFRVPVHAGGAAGGGAADCDASVEARRKQGTLFFFSPHENFKKAAASTRHCFKRSLSPPIMSDFNKIHVYTSD